MLSEGPHLRRPVHPDLTDPDLERLSRFVIDHTLADERDRVEVKIVDGWATMTGKVFTLRSKCDVERHVRSLAGVNGVTNRIEIVRVEPPTIY